MPETPTIAGIGASVIGPATLAGLDTGLARLAAAGCTHAELATPLLCITLAGRDNVARAEAAAEICVRHALQYSLHAPAAVNFMELHHTALHHAVLASTFSFGGRIGAAVAVIHPGRVHPHADRADRARMLAFERDELRRAADVAGKHGICIGMENLNPSQQMMAGTSTSYALDPRRLAEQIVAIDHPHVIGVLDFAHGWLAAARLGFDYCDALTLFSPFVGHLHVTDNCGMPITYLDAAEDEHIAYGMGDLHLPIGWGSVPYDDVLPLLRVRAGTRAILELAARHEEEFERTIPAVRAIADRLNGADA